MAISKSAIVLQDTATKYRVMTTGLAGDATQLTDSVFADVSALKYATTTVTLAAAPTTNFCIGEILTTNDSTPVFMVVQDYTAGAATVDVYRCTSGTDSTPLGWDTASATNVAVGKSLTGSISGLASQLTHGSTRLSINTPTVNLRHLWWDLAPGITYARVYFDGRFIANTLTPTIASRFTNGTDGTDKVNMQLRAAGTTSKASGLENYSVSIGRGVADTVYNVTAGGSSATNVSAIKGPRLSAFALNMKVVTGMNTTKDGTRDVKYTKYGSIAKTVFPDGYTYDFLDTEVIVEGATTGIRFTQAVRIIRRAS